MNGLSSAGDLRDHLQWLLDSKEKQLQQAGTLGQRVLAQQMELEERIRQLQDLDMSAQDEEEVGEEIKVKVRELEDALKGWDEENGRLSSGFSLKNGNGMQPSPKIPIANLPHDDHSRSQGPTAAQSSRRAKNAAHRADDVEFAFEIGSSLLTEVRRLQSLLGERDKAIQDMKEEKDDLEKVVEDMRDNLRSQEQAADKYREENWNLEVTLQDLRSQLSDSQSAAQRAELEVKRLSKLLTNAREASDNQKTETERLTVMLDDLKAKHETDVAQHKKKVATLARDKSDLQQTLDTYKLEIAKAQRRLPGRFGSPLTPGNAVSMAHTPAYGGEDDDDPFSVGGASTNRRKLDNSSLFPPNAFGDEYGMDEIDTPDPSPSKPFLSPTHPANEIEALQQKLAHSQRQISTLKGTLQREKELRMEYRRKMEAAQGRGFSPGGFEDVQEEEEEEEILDDDNVDDFGQTRGRTRAGVSRGRGGRGRSRRVGGGITRNGGKMTLAQKLAAAGAQSTEYLDEEFDDDVREPQPLDELLREAHEEEFTSERMRSPSPTQSVVQPPSNRTSIDGMDPVFANVLKQSPIPLAAAAFQSHSSPLRQSMLSRSRGGTVGSRRNRGGAAFQERRPSSLVGAPEALAAELGINIGMDSVTEDQEPVFEKEMKEFGCQVETAPTVIQLPPIQLPPIHITPTPPEVSEMGVQVQPEPVPEPLPIETKETSMQTDVEVKIVRAMAEMCILTEPMEVQVREVRVEVPVEVVKETVEVGMLTDVPPVVPAPTEIMKETSEMGTSTEVEVPPVPVGIARQTSEMSTFTEAEVLPPPRVLVEKTMNTDSLPARVFVDSTTFTERDILVPTSEVDVQTTPKQRSDAVMQTIQPAVVAPPPKIMSEMEVQTSPVVSKVDSFLFDGDSPTMTPKRHTLMQPDYLRRRNISTTSTVVGAPATSPYRPLTLQEEDDDMGEQTETEFGTAKATETETETDFEDYQDARQSIAPTPTAQDSVEDLDFHSMSTMTDDDYSDMSDGDDEDDASLRPRRMSADSDVSYTQSETFGRRVPFPEREQVKVEYEEQGIGTDPIPEPEPVIQVVREVVREVVRVEVPVEVPVEVLVPAPAPEPIVEEMKREFSESSMQTEEWVPPAPAPAVIPAPASISRPPSSSGHQFQFVAAPSTPTTTLLTPPVFTPPVVSPANSSSNRDSTFNTSNRDSVLTINPRTMRFPATSLATYAERRQSIESAISINGDDTTHSQLSQISQRPASQLLSPVPQVDKSRPPTMMLPPPPRLPPPPSTVGSMPPPSFVPDRARRPGSSLSSRDTRDGPPPRPTSPVPPELIQRATTPNTLLVPGGRITPSGFRQHGSSLPPMSTNLRQLPSTNSFRSAANAAQKYRSVTSLLSDQEDAASRRSSMSSDNHYHRPGQTETTLGVNGNGAGAPVTPGRLSVGGGANGQATTDPAIIHAITQTMIGEFLYKYTRKTIGKGHGEKRHKRFFWVHPYTKTLYWSSADPGSSNVSESSAKSAYIDSVRSVLDPNPVPPGLHQYSVIISTPQREMKLTAPTKERHDIWFNALQYLLARPTNMPITSPGNLGTLNGSPPRRPNVGPVVASPESQRSTRSISNDIHWNTTPRGQRSHSQLSLGGSIGKRSGTPAAEYLRWADGPNSPSIMSLGGTFEHIPGGEEDDEDLDFEINDSMGQSDEGFEGLENVRACCDGKHTVGRSGHDHYHHHHHHHHHQQEHGGTINSLQADLRPSSPAFSFRSRASSVNSRDGGGKGSLFSRFGSRRSTKNRTE